MSQAAIVMLLRWLFALVAVVLVIAFVVRPVLRLMRQKPDLDLITPDYGRMLEGEELEIPTEADEEQFDRARILEQARSDPRATANLVQRWLKERRS